MGVHEQNRTTDTRATAGGANEALTYSPVNISGGNTSLSPAEQQEFDRCCEIIKKGPRTPDGIGEALSIVKRRCLYRGVVGNMAAFLGACVQLGPDEGSKLIADWEKMARHKDSSDEQPRQSVATREPTSEVPVSDDGDDLPKRTARQGMTRSQAALLSELLNLHCEVMDAAKMTLTKAMRMGEILGGFKQTVGHGNWLRWLEENVPFSERTARNYIRVYVHQTEIKSETISDLTDAYRLLAEPKDATEEQAKTDTTGATETTEANEANDDTQSKEEATEDQESTNQAESRPARKPKKKSAKAKSEKTNSQKAKAKKGQTKKFKAQRESVPDEWVKTVDQDISAWVGKYTTDWHRDSAKMLALAHLLRKYAAKIEEDTAEDTGEGANP
jgi:hypothetical protein